MRYANRERVELVGGDVRDLDDAIVRTMPRHDDGRALTRDEIPAVRTLHGETVVGVWLRLRAVDGCDVVMLANASPLRNARGEIVAAVLALHDITQISELARGRRELFSMASHDLRTPLTTILGFVQLARRQLERDPEGAMRALGTLNGNACAW